MCVQESISWEMENQLSSEHEKQAKDTIEEKQREEFLDKPSNRSDHAERRTVESKLSCRD